MRLVSIKATKRLNQVFLVFNNDIKLPLFIDDVAILNLSKGQNIDNDLYKKIIDLSLFFLLKNYGLYLIAISPRIKKDLKFRFKIYLDKTLKKFNISTENNQEIINKVIEFLQTGNLLRNEDYIDSFIRKNTNKSVKYLKFFLEKQGIDRELISSKLGNKSDSDNLKKLISKINPEKLKNKKLKNKLIVSLCRKGFSFEDVKGLIDYIPFPR